MTETNFDTTGDRELLELAAKAADYDVEVSTVGGIGRLFLVGELHEWNPLTDDGDALRLAVKLDMDIWLGCCMATAVNGTDQGPVEFNESQIDDRYAATRRAIVRAAAAIGAAK